MKAYLESIKIMQKEVKQLESLERKTSDKQRKNKILIDIGRLKEIIKTLKEYVQDFINEQLDDIQEAIVSYYYIGKSWRATTNICNSLVSDTYYRKNIERICKHYYRM